jgi:DNA-binding Lrp family transcriptional regulator
MKHVKLDRIDMRILQTLQQEGRITNVELAKRAGISAPPCLRRVKALEQAGFIKSYHADLSAELLNFGVTIFTHVNLDSHHEGDLNAFGELVKSWAMVRECYIVTGESSALLKVVAESWETYQHFITTSLMAAPRVTQVKSTLIIKTMKHQPGIPLGDTISKPKVAGKPKIATA